LEKLILSGKGYFLNKGDKVMSHLYDAMAKAVRLSHYDDVLQLIEQGYGQREERLRFTLHRIEVVAQHLANPPLQSAVVTTRKMMGLSHIGMNERELLMCAYFIETKLFAHIAKREYYLHRDETHLPRTIEYDPKTATPFIHLRTDGGLQTISESHRRASTYSIFYHHATPSLCCNVEEDGSAAMEAAHLETLKGVPGVIQAYTIMHHKSHLNDHSRTSIIFPLYNQGALTSQTAASLTLLEKVQVAENLLTGLDEIHTRGFVHRHITPGAIMIHKDARGIAAVFTGLGQMRSLVQAASAIPNVELFYNPPEALRGVRKHQSKQAGDIFSLGCALFMMLSNTDSLPWMSGEIFSHSLYNEHYHNSKKQKKFLEKIRALRYGLKKELARTMAPVEKSFKELICTMVHQNPEKRLNTVQLLHKIRQR